MENEALVKRDKQIYKLQREYRSVYAWNCRVNIMDTEETAQELITAQSRFIEELKDYVEVLEQEIISRQ